jgi:hypothetical protein
MTKLCSIQTACCWSAGCWQGNRIVFPLNVECCASKLNHHAVIVTCGSMGWVPGPVKLNFEFLIFVPKIPKKKKSDPQSNYLMTTYALYFVPAGDVLVELLW